MSLFLTSPERARKHRKYVNQSIFHFDPLVFIRNKESI